jgi:hypothetical protein
MPAADGKLVVLAAGPSLTGKTTALYELFIRRFPRRVSFDFVGEVREKFNPDAINVFSYREFVAALRRCAVYPRWHIALVYDPDAKPELAEQVCRLLNPPRESEQHQSFAKAVGGVSIDCTEADFLFPNGRTPASVRGIVQRGRHNRLVMLAATQAPALVDTRLRDGADYFLAFRSQEEVVHKFWRGITSAAVADRIATLPPYHCLYIVKAEQRIYHLDASRRVVALLDYTGAEHMGTARVGRTSTLAEV